MKIVVVGINHAGTSALRTLLKQNSENEVVAIDKNDNISFLGCGIALSVSSVVKNVNDLFYSSVEELKSMGAKVLMKHEVIEIDEVNKCVTSINLNDENDDTKTIVESYDKLIYAAGSWPLENKIINTNIENIQICKLYNHAIEIIEKANDPEIKKIAIIGAGYIGIELAEAFKLKGKDVYLVDKDERVTSNYFDNEFCYKIENALNKNKIKLLLGVSVEGFEKNKKTNKVSHIITSNGKYKVDYVINAIGFIPNTKLLPNAAKIKNGAIIVNEYMQSSLENIYVIGDCAAIYNTASKKFENIALATNAVKGGIVAASHINGLNNVKLKSAVGTNAIHIFGQNLTSTGINEKRCKKLGIDYGVVEWTDNERPEFMNEYNKVSIRLVYEKNTLRLLGSQIYSNSTKENHMESIFFLSLAIQKNMSITDVATSDIYFLPHYNKPFNFILGAILKALNLCYIKENC